MRKPDVLSVMAADARGVALWADNCPERARPGWVTQLQLHDDAAAAVAEAFDTIAEGKRQWDQVAASLGVDGDDADAVMARAAAVSELVEAGRELVKTEAEYHRLVNERLPAALAWNRVTAARHRHASALDRFGSTP